MEIAIYIFHILYTMTKKLSGKILHENILLSSQKYFLLASQPAPIILLHTHVLVCARKIKRGLALHRMMRQRLLLIVRTKTKRFDRHYCYCLYSVQACIVIVRSRSVDQHPTRRRRFVII